MKIICQLLLLPLFCDLKAVIGEPAANDFDHSNFFSPSSSVRVSDSLLDVGDTEAVSVVVNLRERPDLRPLGAIKDKNAKAAAVLNELKTSSARSQGSLLKFLEAQADVSEVKTYYIANAVIVSGRGSIIDKIRHRSDIESIVSNAPFKIPIEKFDNVDSSDGRGRHRLRHGGRRLQTTYQWNIEMVGADRVHQDYGTGVGGIVANQDTGIMHMHDILGDNYRGNSPDQDHNYNWYDGVRRSLDPNSDSNAACGFSSPSPCDDHGHGTHTLGTSVGSDGYGVAPGALWMACRNMDAGWGHPESYLNCFEFFLAPHDLNGENPDITLRPHVIGNSWGCPPDEGCTGSEFTQILSNLKEAGIAVVFSAGNAGPSCGSIGFPASEFNTTSVGSVTSTESISGFSSRGPIPESGRIEPALVAPGSSVWSAWIDGGYYQASGTSMASPHVTGAWALIASLCPSYAFDVDATEALLLRNTKKLYTSPDCGTDTISSSPNNVFGHGLLDIYAAVEECSICNKNGICEAGEDCQNCKIDCVSGSGVQDLCGNGVCNIGDGEDCLSCPADCSGSQGGRKDRRFCCGDGAGENPIDCSDSRCGGPSSCTMSPTPPASSFCCGNGGCESGEDSNNCLLDCPFGTEICDNGVDDDGDGFTDCNDTDDCPCGTLFCDSFTGACVECTDNSNCGAPTPYCDTILNECAQCTDDSHCLVVDETCQSGVCAPTQQCSPVGTQCGNTGDLPCCSQKCTGKSGSKTCK